MVAVSLIIILYFLFLFGVLYWVASQYGHTTKSQFISSFFDFKGIYFKIFIHMCAVSSNIGVMLHYYESKEHREESRLHDVYLFEGVLSSFIAYRVISAIAIYYFTYDINKR